MSLEGRGSVGGGPPLAVPLSDSVCQGTNHRQGAATRGGDAVVDSQGAARAGGEVSVSVWRLPPVQRAALPRIVQAGGKVQAPLSAWRRRT
jgi:hypothetical protein